MHCAGIDEQNSTRVSIVRAGKLCKLLGETMIKPSPAQVKLWYMALTTLAFAVVIGAVLVSFYWLSQVAGLLQPVLVPVAVAVVIAYLLDPVVDWLGRKTRLSRVGATSVVFVALFACAAGFLLWIIPAAYHQGTFVVNNFPQYSQRVQNVAVNAVAEIQKWSELPIFRKPEEGEQRDALTNYAATAISDGARWLQDKAPEFANSAGRFATRSLGGVLGAFGFILSMVLVPIFLFFFLVDGHRIGANWGTYLPLRASPFKAEIVSLVGEINQYLIAFFRGQMLVSLIDGALIAIALSIMGMDFAILIGLMVGILGLIPYAGVFISWIPAVLIAAAQFNDWQHPLAVTIIFLLVNNLDGMFIAPRIVGESVGLHPLTVIISVLCWSLILGGLLGALLAVPLTATLKVLLRRYFWAVPGSSPPVESGPSP